MALVDQDKKKKIEGVNSYIKGKIQEVDLKLFQETNPGGIYDGTYVGGLDASAKSDEGDIIKMLRWLADNLGFTVPPAFSDAEVDAIDPNIRQKEV